MKRKQLYFLLGAALVLASAGAIFEIAQSFGWKGSAAGVEPFANLPINSVEKLVITSSKDKVTLQKVNDVWTVAERNGYPADFSQIRELLTSLWEFKVVRQLDVGPSQFGRLNIVPPGQGDNSGVAVDLRDSGGKAIKTLIFGKPFGGDNSSQEDEGESPRMPKLPDANGANGRFVYDPSEKDKVYLSAENFSTLDASPKSWLDKDFIKDNGVKEVERESSPGNEGWTVARKDAQANMELVGAKPGETPKPQAVALLANFFPNLVDVKPANTPDSETGLDKAVIANLQTFDGFKYALQIGGEAPDKSRFFRFKVSADLPTTRTAEPNESPDDKKKKDDEFAKQQETLKTRLAAEQKLQNWIFEAEELDTFVKPRADILQGPSPTPSPRPAGRAVHPKPSVPVPHVATPTPAPAAPSPSPESSATPEVTATPETSPSPVTSPGPEMTPSPETTPSQQATPNPETTPSVETSPSPEAVPSSSPSPSATPET